MGSYGIGSERLMQVVIELCHDDDGIQWPISIAPYQISLVSLGNDKTPDVIAACDKIYADLQAAGFEVLYDDRTTNGLASNSTTPICWAFRYA